jgi:hypothetical protein
MPWALAAIYAWELFNDFQAGGGAPIPAFGSTPNVICGPDDFPGPPYRYQRNYYFLGGTVTTPFCGLGGQSVAGFATAWSPGLNTMLASYGPNEALLPVVRVFHYQQWTLNSDPVTFQPALLPGPSAPGLPGVAGGMPVPVIVPVQLPLPIWTVPFLRPDWRPDGNVRGYFVQEGIGDATSPNKKTGAIAFPSAPPIDKPPDIDEREKKLGAETRVGRAVVSGFRFLNDVGAANGAVGALYYAIPQGIRGLRPRSAAGKWRFVFDHFADVQFGDALVNSLRFAVTRRLAALYYSTALKGITAVAGERGGWNAFHLLNTLASAGEHESVRNRLLAHQNRTSEYWRKRNAYWARRNARRRKRL